MPKKSKLPRNALVVREYDKFEQYVSSFANGNLNLLILISNPGTGKSNSVRHAIGKDALWIEGSASAFGIYRALYRNLHKPVIIDDVDELFRDRSAIRLLKCLCQTDPVKRVSWYTNSTKAGSGVPSQFETTSQTIIIANEWETLNKNVSAVQDRGHLIFFRPTPASIHEKVAEWFWDQEIYDFVGGNLHHFPNLSMRSYVNAAELKHAGLDWMDVFHAECECVKTLLVSQLLHDERYIDDKDRLKAFCRAGGGTRSTYYLYKKKIAALSRKKGEIPSVKVRGKRPRKQPRLNVITGHFS